MALTEYAVGHPLAVRLWAKRLFVETLRETYVDRFIGSDNGSIVQMRDELKKSAGDRVTIGLRLQLSGAGIQGDNTLEGNEEALTTYNDTIIIDQLRHAVRSKGKMSEQRVPFSVRQEAMDGLRDWWADRIDQSFFNQLCGFTAQSDVRFTGLQAALAPDATHIFRPNSRTTDESLTTGDEMSLTHIDRVIARLKAWQTTVNSTVPMRPIRYKGGLYYVLFIHPYQTFQLRTNTSTGQWADIQKARVIGSTGNGPDGYDNPIFAGGSFVGIYNQCVIHESGRVTNGVNSTTGVAVANARRAVLCGAQAALMATGRDESDPQGQKMTWVEESFDYNNQLGVAAGMVLGLKKTQFNSSDFATVVIATYSPQP
ncbi:MAG: N4-gp56 family major capsid protein [Desulfurellales bacterium]|nr:MAG: N4-gp56 family major capsid protein [Desulfurellales bacterium]